MTGVENVNIQLSLLGSSATRPMEPRVAMELAADTETEREECQTGGFEIRENVSYSQESFSQSSYVER